MRHLVYQFLAKAIIIAGYLSLLMLATGTTEQKQTVDAAPLDFSEPLN